MPCIYRRAALHKIGKDNQLYGIDLFSANDIYDKYDFPALFNFLDRSLSEQQIKRTLLVAGSIPFAEIDSSASLVVRVRAEIKKWIEDKGNDSLKRLAHVL
jgi:hypothetical protein